MIKNGGRLLRAGRAADRKGKAEQPRMRYAPHHHQDQYSGPASLPPPFLLPAWAASTTEKPVARPSSRQLSRQPILRHASSYAHAEPVRGHEVYAPDWLATDADDPPATASTSKALLPLESSKAIQDTSRSLEVQPKAVYSKLNHLSNAKGKAPERQVTPVASNDTLQMSHPTASKSLACAIEGAVSYLQHEKHSCTIQQRQSCSTAKAYHMFDFPVATLPMDLLRTLIYSTNTITSTRSTTLTPSEAFLVSQRLHARFVQACNVLDAVLRRIADESPLTESEEAIVQHTLHSLVFLERDSVSAILDSLHMSYDVDGTVYKSISRILHDTLLTYIYRDAKRHAHQFEPSPSSSPSSKPMTFPCGSVEDTQIEQDFLVKHIAHSTRRLRHLCPSRRASFAAAHVQLFRDITLSLSLDHPGTPSAVLRILQGLEGFDTVSKPQEQLDQAIENILEILSVPLRHMCSPSRRRSTLKDSIFKRNLEDSLLRVWSSCVPPFLKHHYHDASPPVTICRALHSLQRAAIRARMARFASAIVLDALVPDKRPVKPLKCPATLQSEMWRSTIDLCLRTGHREEAEALLKGLYSTAINQDTSAQNSMYWHLRLQAILKSDITESSSFFAKLDTLLQQMQASGYRPDYYFISTLLRQIPTFPTRLDKACDLFHAALSLAETESVLHSSEASLRPVPSYLRLAASHGDLGLFERGRLEAVQLPWAPILATDRKQNVQLETQPTSDISLEELLAKATNASQRMRFALLRGRNDEAMSAFQHLTSCLQSGAAASHNGGFTSITYIGPAYETLKTMWQASFVRMLSTSLQRQDLSASINLFNLSVTKLGSRYVGQQAAKRLFLAACSPRFHAQSETPAHQGPAVPVINWPAFARTLSSIRLWAEDLLASDSEMLKSVVDTDLTSKQRLRSVLSRDSSSRVLAQTLVSCLIPAMFAAENSNTTSAHYEEPDGLDPALAMQEVLSTMVTLQVNCNYIKWWERVEKIAEDHMDSWKMSMQQRTNWREKSRQIAKMCAQVENNRRATAHMPS